MLRRDRHPVTWSEFVHVGRVLALSFIGLRNVRQDKRPVGAPAWQSRALILLRASKSCINSNRFKIKPAANV